MGKMTIVITMAGLGSRFRKAGYTIPKYAIEVNGHTLFHWSMTSLKGFSTKHYVFIVRKEDRAKEFIKSECASLGVIPSIVEIDFRTSGQAETALLAELYWEAGSPLLIYNIDTFVEPYHMREEEMKGDGFIPCFQGKGDHWSFVRLGHDGKAVEVKEKKRISDYCSVGAYYFKTAELYKRLYNEFYSKETNNIEAGEQYIAPLYNYLISQTHGEVYISDIEAQFVHVLGTPEEVEAFRKCHNFWTKSSRS